MSDYDALIIGGGPAGSTLAALLAQQNRRVVVIERDRFPRFQVGESLLPQSVEVFAKLGLNGQFDGRFIRKYGAIFDCADSGRQCQYEFEDAISPQYPYAYQVQRAEFDSLLLDRARELGAEVIPVGVSPDGTNINRGCGSTQPAVAAETVVAHGAHVIAVLRQHRSGDRQQHIVQHVGGDAAERRRGRASITLHRAHAPAEQHLVSGGRRCGRLRRLRA